jgi:hypothetical protein
MVRKNITLDIVRAGLHCSLSMSRQIFPLLLMLGWNTLVLNATCKILNRSYSPSQSLILQTTEVKYSWCRLNCCHVAVTETLMPWPKSQLRTFLLKQPCIHNKSYNIFKVVGKHILLGYYTQTKEETFWLSKVTY